MTTSELSRDQRVRAAFWLLRWERRGEPALVTSHRAAELTPGWNGQPLVGTLGDHETTMTLTTVATELQRVSPGYEAGGALLALVAHRPERVRTWA